VADNPDEEKMLTGLIPLLKSKTGIDMESNVVPWDEFETKLMTMYASGIAPDIYGTGGTNPYIERWVRGMVLELDNFIAQEPASFISDLHPVALNAYKKKGKTVAMTFAICAAGTWINATRFDEASVAYPPFDWTTTDMVATAKQLTLSSKNDGKIDRFGLSWDHSGPWYNTRLWGQDLVSKEDYDSGVLRTITAIKDPAVKEALIASLQARADTVLVDKVSPSPETAASLNQIGPMLKTGSIAMQLAGGWAVWGDMPADFKFRAAINPKGGANGSGTRCNNIWAEPLEINSQTKQPDAAWKFVRFMVSDADATDVMLKHRNLIPAGKSSFDKFVAAQGTRLAMTVAEQSTFYKGALEQANTTVPDHILVGWAKVRDVFGSNLDPLWLGEKKASEVVETMLPLAQAAIDANLKELKL
jgi:multiple sugar transport system substrate-binding protein